MRRIPAAVVLAATLLLSACGAALGTLSEGARQTELAGALLTLDDVTAARSIPAGMTDVEPGRANLTDDEDQRGPCGAPVDPLPTVTTSESDSATRFDGAIAVFGTDDFLVVNVVLADTGGLAERRTTALIDDLQPDCEGYEKEETPFEEPQATRLVGAIDIGDLGDQRVAFQIRAVVGDEDPAFGVEAAIRSGDALTEVLILSSERVPDETVADLAASAAERLATLQSG
jgi:hypothetical protein